MSYTDRRYLCSVNLCGYEIDIHIVHDLRDDGGTQLYGRALLDKCEIILDEAILEYQALFYDTLWHEILHFVSFLSVSDLNETTIGRIAPLLQQAHFSLMQDACLKFLRKARRDCR